MSGWLVSRDEHTRILFGIALPNFSPTGLYSLDNTPEGTPIGGPPAAYPTGEKTKPNLCDFSPPTMY